MLKRNLFAIVIVMLGLVMASNAFGQRGGTEKRPDKNNPDFDKKEYQLYPIRVANQEEYMAGGIAILTREPLVNPQTSRTKRNPAKPNKQITHDPEFEEVKSPRDVATKRIQSAREAGSRMATGKIKQKPKNLGDTATHEVGY